MHKQRRVEQQLAIELLYFGKQWHPPHHDGIVTMRVLLLLSLATIFLAEPCQPKPMQLACTRKGVLSSNWSLFHISASSGTTPHLGGGGFLLWGAACAPRGGDVIGILEQQLAFKTCANVSSSANLLLRPLVTVDMLTVAAHRHGAI